MQYRFNVDGLDVQFDVSDDGRLLNGKPTKVERILNADSTYSFDVNIDDMYIPRHVYLSGKGDEYKQYVKDKFLLANGYELGKKYGIQRRRELPINSVVESGKPKKTTKKEENKNVKKVGGSKKPKTSKK